MRRCCYSGRACDPFSTSVAPDVRTQGRISVALGAGIKWGMQKLTIALGIWAAIGPLLGIFVGHFLTRSWQREQARLDNIKAEYRELLTALADAYTIFIRLGPRDEEVAQQCNAFDEARAASLRVMHDRIYIAERVEREKWLFYWTGMIANYRTDNDRLTLTNAFTDFQEKIRTAAFDDLNMVKGLTKRKKVKHDR